MPNIKPISELRNYGELLREVTVGSPVFLTKNGHGRYAVMDMHDYEKMQTTLELMNEIVCGRYLAFYHDFQDAVLVDRILYNKRNYQALLLETKTH